MEGDSVILFVKTCALVRVKRCITSGDRSFHPCCNECL